MYSSVYLVNYFSRFKNKENEAKKNVDTKRDDMWCDHWDFTCAMVSNRFYGVCLGKCFRVRALHTVLASNVVE